jgi:hypothetical protein
MLPFVNELQQKARLEAPFGEQLNKIITDYTHQHRLPGPWLEGLQLFQNKGLSQD